jgi:tyrosyl-tRNA synthetase
MAIDIYFLCLELTLFDVCKAAKCFSNESVALKVINDGGVSVNHKKISNPHAVLVFGIHVLPNLITVLRVGKSSQHSTMISRQNDMFVLELGKKNFYMIRWTHEQPR